MILKQKIKCGKKAKGIIYNQLLICLNEAQYTYTCIHNHLQSRRVG